MRCYLSRLENGHTIPSLGTLAKLATAMDVPLARFFVGSGAEDEQRLPLLTKDEIRFLTQVRSYSSNLNESDRKLVLFMVKQMASMTSS
jgi:transcriptional regulator with XRE-family HTH domain